MTAASPLLFKKVIVKEVHLMDTPNALCDNTPRILFCIKYYLCSPGDNFVNTVENGTENDL